MNQQQQNPWEAQILNEQYVKLKKDNDWTQMLRDQIGAAMGYHPNVDSRYRGYYDSARFATLGQLLNPSSGGSGGRGGGGGSVSLPPPEMSLTEETARREANVAEAEARKDYAQRFGSY